MLVVFLQGVFGATCQPCSQCCQHCEVQVVPLGVRHGRVGPTCRYRNLQSLSAEQQDLVRAHSDQPGGISRESFVADVRQAKKARLDGSQAPGPAGEAFVEEDIDDLLKEQIRHGETQDQASQADSPIDAKLRNMAWWDGLGYSELKSWVPTLGRVPKDVHHGLALLPIQQKTKNNPKGFRSTKNQHRKPPEASEASPMGFRSNNNQHRKPPGSIGSLPNGPPIQQKSASEAPKKHRKPSH